MGDASFINLHFKDSGEWSSLPKWAEYFINVGKQLAITEFDSKSRIVTSIVVPTRAYCAAFISLGMVVSDSVKIDHPSQVAHFKKLLGLQPGETVVVRLGHGKTYMGVIKQQKESHGKLWIGVLLHYNGKEELIHWIDETTALQVHPAQHSGKLSRKQSGRNKRFSNEFISKLLGDSDPIHLGIQSKLVCAIVGKKNLLEHEIVHTPLAVHSDDGCHAEGSLQDVLKVDRFITGEKSHRSALIPVVASQVSNDIINKVEKCVVFDGAVGLLKWGSTWPDRHQVIILDRTEPYFDDAINAINCRFSQNRITSDLSLPYSDRPLPPGAEVLTFRELVL